jgi:hypothetical protein
MGEWRGDTISLLPCGLKLYFWVQIQNEGDAAGPPHALPEQRQMDRRSVRRPSRDRQDSSSPGLSSIDDNENGIMTMRIRATRASQECLSTSASRFCAI